MRVLHVGDDFAALRPCGLTLYSDALMRAQLARGHEVSYVFSGRHYPRLDRPRVKRWSMSGIAMYELIGSTILSHWEAGTRRPDRDLADAAGEAAFCAAMREARPELVHIHELARLPSSVIELAQAAGLPVVMGLYDYKPVCATVRLLDGAARRCLKQEIGEECARNCSLAPSDRTHLVEWTMQWERRRLKQAVPLLHRLDFSRLGPLVGATTKMLRSGELSPDTPTPDESSEPSVPGREYQRRRDVNISRLNMCDRLIAISRREAEIYTTLGVNSARMSVQRLTLPHFDALRPRSGCQVSRPLRFVTLGGCASVAKGSEVIAEAVERLEAVGRGADYELLITGHIEPAAWRRLEGVPSVALCESNGRNDLSLLDRADIGLLPSVWEEAHGFVGIEMLAKGLPLIGNALGGIPEYVLPGVTGWLNETASGAELADLMLGAIANPAEVERLRASVRQRRDQLIRPMREHVDEVDDVYDEVLSAAGS